MQSQRHAKSSCKLQRLRELNMQPGNPTNCHGSQCSWWIKRWTDPRWQVGREPPPQPSKRYFVGLEIQHQELLYNGESTTMERVMVRATENPRKCSAQWHENPRTRVRRDSNDRYNSECRKNLTINITSTKELNFVINILSINVNRYKRKSYITK